MAGSLSVMKDSYLSVKCSGSISRPRQASQCRATSLQVARSASSGPATSQRRTHPLRPDGGHGERYREVSCSGI